jgi:hypothetical protein
MVSADAWHGGETTGGGAGHTTQSGDRKATQKDEDLLARIGEKIGFLM